MRRLKRPKPDPLGQQFSSTSFEDNILAEPMDEHSFCSTYQQDFSKGKWLWWVCNSTIHIVCCGGGSFLARSRHQRDKPRSHSEESLDYKLSSSHQDYQSKKMPACLQGSTTRHGNTKYQGTEKIAGVTPFTRKTRDIYATTYSKDYSMPKKDLGKRKAIKTVKN